MTASGVIDVHAHYFPGEALPAPIGGGFPSAPRLEVDSQGSGRIVRGGSTFRAVRSSLWDVSARLAEMDAAGIGVQAISPMPVVLEYDAPRAAFAAYCRWINGAIADAVGVAGGRLVGLGTVPLLSQDDSVAELDHLYFDLGLRGVEIGTRVAGMELDDPRLDFFFRHADQLGLAVLVHPVDGGGGALRRGGFTYDFGLGMPSDTSLAAAALVFGGVLERHPSLRVALVHGGGTFPWAYPRLRLGAAIAGSHTPDETDKLVRRLFVDTLVFDPEHLRLLGHRFGTDRILLGSDHPFIPDQPAGGMEDVEGASADSTLIHAERVFRLNALEYLGLSDKTESASDVLPELRRSIPESKGASNGTD